jgi:hypothetical protein
MVRFLRSSTAAHSGLDSATPAAEVAELERMAEQMRAYARVRSLEEAIIAILSESLALRVSRRQDLERMLKILLFSRSMDQ